MTVGFQEAPLTRMEPAAPADCVAFQRLLIVIPAGNVVAQVLASVDAVVIATSAQ